MPRRRDRHDRGIRGPLALPNQITGRQVLLPGTPSRQEYFTDCVSRAVERIQQTCPGGLDGIDIGIEEVPAFGAGIDGNRVPLAVAVEATLNECARIVVYRRPLEQRCENRPELRRLVHRTMAEQLAALTARRVEEIDPSLDDEDRDW